MPSYGPEPSSTNKVERDPWIALAKDAYDKSTSYIENNYRKQWEDGLRMFQSRHPRDSKYNSEHYKYRSRLFRPKTRSMIRKHEATANVAFFSNPDIIAIDPTVSDDQMQVASSVVMKELLTYRLTKSIPWYLTVQGALQDAMTMGVAVSFQYWRYTAKKEKQTVQGVLPLFGEVSFEQEVEIPIEDKPCVELIPIENLRFDPAAHWYDIARTSPYIIVLMPMYVRDVLDRMEDIGPAKWRRYSKEDILASRVTTDDPVHAARTENKEDPQQQTSQFNEFDTVMIHLNMIRSNGEDWAYYTLGTEKLLTDPVTVSEMFRHCDTYGDRPIHVGFAVVETHKAVPTSATGIGKDLQTEANEIVNQRLDNVKLVLNKRYVVRRGSNIDVDSLLRNVPGGVSMAGNVEQDLREIDFQDVTQSAYAEQDRVNVDYDELLGSFAQSSVMTNRRMNETVGGMRMLAQGANVITEYTLRTFVETWMEPVLRQLVKLEQYYETDEIVMALAAGRAKLFQRLGSDQITDALLRQELTLSVNVGMGATDPDTRFQRFLQAMGAYSKLANEGSKDLALPEVRKELFGLAGFKDAARFFQQVDPRLLQAQQMMQQAEAMAKQIVDQAKMQLLERARELDNREHDIEIKLLEAEQEFMGAAQKAQNELALKQRDQEFKHMLEVRKVTQTMGLKETEAALEAKLNERKAQLDASIKVFQANIDAALKQYMARVDAKVKQLSAPKEKPAN